MGYKALGVLTLPALNIWDLAKIKSIWPALNKNKAARRSPTTILTRQHSIGQNAMLFRVLWPWITQTRQPHIYIVHSWLPTHTHCVTKSYRRQHCHHLENKSSQFTCNKIQRRQPWAQTSKGRSHLLVSHGTDPRFPLSAPISIGGPHLVLCFLGSAKSRGNVKRSALGEFLSGC
jgi:hypothetical protein